MYQSTSLRYYYSLLSSSICITNRFLLSHLFTGCFDLPCIQKKSPVKNDLLDFTSEDLLRFTSQFSPENLVGLTHLGKLYRGKMPVGSDEGEVSKDVAVKILGHHKRHYIADDRLRRLEYELKFLQAPRIRGNPNLVKVIGSCREEETLGIVYDLNPHDTLQNLITRADFNWLQSVKTALTLARLLNYLHDRKYLIRNFAPSHIVVDQNFTPIMFEFGILVGGILGNKIEEFDMRLAPYGYIDGSIIKYGPDSFSIKSDVFALGIFLLNFISKRVVDNENPPRTIFDLWALEEFKRGRSLVHQSLVDDPDFDPHDGAIITELALQCVEEEKKKRPETKEVVARLEALRVVQEHAW